MNIISDLDAVISKADQAQYLNAGATDEQIAQFRQQIGDDIANALPESFYAFYAWHNGSVMGEDDAESFHEGYPILQLEGVANHWESWRDMAADGSFKEFVENAWWDPAWVPFICTDWYIQVIDTKGSFGGVPGQILGFDFQSADDRYIYHASFDDWLKTMTAYGQKGLLRLGNLDEETWDIHEGETHTDEEESEMIRIAEKLNPGYPWSNDMTALRATAQTQENSHWSSLEAAIQSDDLAALQTMINAKQIGVNEQNSHLEANQTPSHLAAQHKAWACLLWLVEQKADLSINDAYGFTPMSKMVSDYRVMESDSPLSQNITTILDAASNNGHTLELAVIAIKALEQHDDRLLSFAFKQGCPIDSIDRWTNNPLLHMAAKHAYFAGYLKLIALGANEDALNSNEQTVFEFLDGHCATVIRATIDHLAKDYIGQEYEQAKRYLSFYRATERLDAFPYLDEFMTALNKPA